MTIVEREISAYTHHNIIIGVFENTEKAHRARETYIEHCKEKDPWAEQANWTVNLDADVTMKDVSDLVEGEPGGDFNELHVVSCFEEGFGQVTRKTEKIFLNKEDAETYLESKETEESEYEPSYYDVSTVEMNEIYFEGLE